MPPLARLGPSDATLFEYYELANNELGLNVAERPVACADASPAPAADVVPGGHGCRQLVDTTR